ncbi:MAG: porphobilinogen synthase [Flavobacteriales bacterium]|nr:porphobilinogen synthase [Flavobacteriales bacterium]
MQTQRPRRLRKSAAIRSLVAETRLSREALIYPYFVIPGIGKKDAINAMPGISRFSKDMLLTDVEEGLRLGLNKIILFGVGEEKTEDASSSYAKGSVVADAVRLLKKSFGKDLVVITDVCLCAYTTHGHCGLIEHDHVVNDASVEVLAKMARAHAEAGADMVAPSDMMDGRVGRIRAMLDKHGLEETGIMSYAVKYASAYYGPFREAADSAPSSGDRKSYQMDVRNRREALREAQLDEEEGADILMVKPALAFLDIIRDVRENTDLPVACYNVSGEYAMVKATAAAGLVDERQIVTENMTAFHRAGADIILTYHARDIAANNWF